MTSRTFAILNRNAIGQGLVLDDGNLVVTTEEVSTAGTSTVLATLPKAVGKARFDTYFYSNLRADLTGMCAVGLARTEVDLNAYLGDDQYGWAMRPGEGGIWNNGVMVTPGQSVPERVAITVVCAFNASAGPFLQWYVDNSPYASVFLPTDSFGGFFWLPAVSVGGSVPGDVSAFCNFGQRPFDGQPLPVNS